MHFGDWDGGEASIMTSLHKVLLPIMPEEAHRNIVLSVLNARRDKARPEFGDALDAKRITDLYLVLVADRLWEQRVNSTEST
jgi:hypothetical protein